MSIYVCEKCNSKNIHQITWVDFNSREDLFAPDSGNVIVCGECDNEWGIKNERETNEKHRMSRNTYRHIHSIKR